MKSESSHPLATSVGRAALATYPRKLSWSVRWPVSLPRLPSSGTSAVCVLLLTLSACSPAYNWREIRPEGTPVTALFPCKPDTFERQVKLEGAQLTVRMDSCEASGQVFAISRVQVPSGATSAALMQSLRGATVQNLAPASILEKTQPLKGVSPEMSSPRLYLKSQAAAPIQAEMQTILFTDGVAVFQATLVGSPTESEIPNIFFEGISLAPGAVR